MPSFTKFILIIVAGFLSAVGLYTLLVRPNISGVNKQYMKSVDAQTELKTLSEQVTAYKNSQADLNSVSNKSRIINAILERENLEVAIKEIEAAAAASGIESGLAIHDDEASTALQKIKPVVGGKIGVDEVAYTLSISGPYQSVLVFISYLEHLPHFTEISAINLSAATSLAGTDAIVEHDGNVLGTIDAVFFVKGKSSK